MPSRISIPAAQLMCDSLEPVNGIETNMLTQSSILFTPLGQPSTTMITYNFWDAINSNPDEYPKFSLYSLKINCTLIYRKELNYRVRRPNQIISKCTDEGIIVTEKLPNFSFYDESSNPDDVDSNTFFWDKRVKLQLPILKLVTEEEDNTFTVSTYINYFHDQCIDGLQYKGANNQVHKIMTSDLYQVQNLISDDHPIPAVMNVLFPYGNDQLPDVFIVPPLQKITKVPIQVPPRADKLLHEVSKDLASKTVDNFIGLAMQRMQSNRQGDLLLCF